jgi:hypothetical protein
MENEQEQGRDRTHIRRQNGGGRGLGTIDLCFTLRPLSAPWAVDGNETAVQFTPDAPSALAISN